MATEVALINKSSGDRVFYSTYAAARAAASMGDKIQIWANLTNQQISLAPYRLVSDKAVNPNYASRRLCRAGGP